MKSSEIVLYICAGLLLSGGVILGGSTAWCLVRISYYFWLTDLGAQLGGGVLLVAGSLLSLPAAWLATAAPQKPRCLPLLGSLLCITAVAIMVLSSGLGTYSSLSATLRSPSALNTSMLRAMMNAKLNCDIGSSFASMQTELKCCGVHSHTDWFAYRPDLPQSCCGRWRNGHHKKMQDITVCHTPIFFRGCLAPAMSELRNYINSITILAYSLILVLTTTLLAAGYIMASNAVLYKDRSKSPNLPRVTCISQFGPCEVRHVTPQPSLQNNVRSAPPMSAILTPAYI